MKISYGEDVKGVLIADINGTINTLPYFDNKDLLRLVNSIKNYEMQIVDFEKKSTYIILSEEDLERIRDDYNV